MRYINIYLLSLLLLLFSVYHVLITVRTPTGLELSETVNNVVFVVERRTLPDNKKIKKRLLTALKDIT